MYTVHFLFEVIKGWLRGYISMDKRCKHFQFQVIDCSHTSWNTLAFGHCRIIYLHIIINFYDSLKKENSTCLQTLKKYLVNASADAKLHITDWCLVNCTDIPGQQNCSDCGIFTCIYARCLAEKCTMNFNHNDIPKIKHHMILELLSKTLIDF